MDQRCDAEVCPHCGRRIAPRGGRSCPHCGGPIPAPTGRSRAMLGWLHLPMRYPKLYAWFVFVASLDIMLTRIVLFFEGTEDNPIAEAIISRRGLVGIVVFKFSLVVFLILMCEVIGRRRDQAGRRLARWCVVVTALPVVAAFSQLWIARSDLVAGPSDLAPDSQIVPSGRPTPPEPGGAQGRPTPTPADDLHGES